MDLYNIAVARKLSGGGGGGGGGDSDSTTAQVTIQITNEQFATINIPTVISSPMDAIWDRIYDQQSASSPQSLIVPLYKGALIVDGNWTAATVNASGNVQVMGNSFLITGDCTITIS